MACFLTHVIDMMVKINLLRKVGNMASSSLGFIYWLYSLCRLVLHGLVFISVSSFSDVFFSVASNLFRRREYLLSE